MIRNSKAFWLSAATLGAMLVAGSEASAQSQRAGIQYGRGDRRFEGNRVTPGYVTGNSLRDFRRLAYSLNVETDRLVAVAEQSTGQGDRGDRSMTELRRFAQRASDLSRNSGGDAINSRETGAVVGQMMDDARQNDRTMRESHEFPKVEWTASIHLLEQMSTAVPRP